MEKDRSAKGKKDIVLRAAIAVSLFHGINGAVFSGAAPTYDIYPKQKVSSEIVPQNTPETNPDTITHSEIIAGLSYPSPMQNPEQQKLNEYLNQEETIVAIMQNRPDLFDGKQIADVKMYYPIYKAVADKFGIDWEVLWITHEAETGASDSTTAFDNNARFWGGFQRDRQSWTGVHVQAAFKEVFANLPEIASLPTRNRSDAQEAAFAGYLLSNNIHQYAYLGPNKALFNAFELYTASGPQAQKRLQRVEAVEKAFSPDPIVYKGMKPV